MTAIIIFLGLIIGLNCIPLLTKSTFPNIEKVVVRILIATSVLFLTFEIFAFYGYRLKAVYVLSAISCTLIVSAIVYFIIFQNTIKKFVIIFLLTPLIAISILTLFLGQVVYENKIDGSYKISVTKGGFLACGEMIRITQTRFGIFDKEVFHVKDLCLVGITKIKTIKFDDKHAEFLIYHDGKHDSENPYKFDVERKKDW
jgi:hypothetical protein